MSAGLGVQVVVETDPEAEERLVEELFTAVLADIGADAEDHDVEDEDEELDEDDDRVVLAVAVARADGKLLGWASLLGPDEDDPGPTVQWLLLSREIERIKTGMYDEHPATPEEIALLVAMTKAAADHARSAGNDAIVWSDPMADLDAHVASALGAEPDEELGHIWAFDDLTSVAAPAGLPAVRTQVATEPTENLPEGTDVITIDVVDTDVELSALIKGNRAMVEEISHHDTEPEVVAAAIHDLVSKIRELNPDVRTLRVHEYDDEVVEDAAGLAGMTVAKQLHFYRLDL